MPLGVRWVLYGSSEAMSAASRGSCNAFSCPCRPSRSCPAPPQCRAPSGLGAPARAQPVQLASMEVVTHSSSFTGLPQYVSFIPGLATCTLPSPLA